jgi:hypothetical protein
MIIFAFLGFLIFGLIAIAAGFVLKWISSLISPFLASFTGKDQTRIESWVQTSILFSVTLVLLFFSQKSCSYGKSIHNELQPVVSPEELAYISLGWILLATAVICSGIALWRIKIAIYGHKPKTRKVF